MSVTKYVFNPFTQKLDAINDLSTGTAADELLWYCATDLKYYRASVVLDPDVLLPTWAFTHVAVLRNIIDELTNQMIDELGNIMVETY